MEQSADQVTGFVATVVKVIEMVATPPGVGLIVNLTIVQCLQAWDHLFPHKMHQPGTDDISKPMAITLSVVLSIPIFAAICWLARWDVRGVNVLYGIIGGLGGVVISALLDKLGWNLDQMFGQEDTQHHP